MGQSNLKMRLDSLMNRRGTDLLRFINSRIFKRLRNHISPEDILAEAVSYVIERPDLAESRQSEDDLFGFLAWKAKMLICDKARRISRTEEIEASLVPDLQIAPSPTLVLHREDKREALLQCIERISNTEQKKIIELVIIQGMTVGEAAQQMQRSPAATRTLLWRAMGLLSQKANRGDVKKYDTSGVTS